MASVTFVLGCGGLHGWSVAVSGASASPKFGSDTGNIKTIQFTDCDDAKALTVTAGGPHDDVVLDLRVTEQGVTGASIAKALGKGVGGSGAGKVQ